MNRAQRALHDDPYGESRRRANAEYALDNDEWSRAQRASGARVPRQRDYMRSAESSRRAGPGSAFRRFMEG